MTVYDLSNYYTAILKTNSTNSIIWQSAYAFHPIIKSLPIDKNEQIFYIGFLMNSTVIVKSDTLTGAINSAINM